MGSTERRERERAETRKKLMDAAGRLFAARGYDAVSLRQVADLAEYSPTAVYVHFKDKADLIRQVTYDAFGQFEAPLVAMRSIPDPIDRIYAVGIAYIRFAVEHPHHYRLMFMTPPHESTPPEPDEIQNPDLSGYGVLRNSCREGAAAGRFKPCYNDPELLTQTLWATVHGVASLQIVAEAHTWIPWRSVEARAHAACRGMLDGLTEEGTEARRHEGEDG
ncbi:MAG: TetR/AcrR family transcriptional regulator [Phycisphaerae bacterium]